MGALGSSMANWYLMRATGIVSLVLLTAVMVLGIGTVRRWRPPNAPAFVTAAVHRSVSLISVVFVAVHVLTAVFDPYASVSVISTVVPFVGSGRPLWVGLGALSLDLIAALIVSSLLRRHLGARAWRSIHWLAYLSWPVAAAHSIGMGSDVGSTWMRVIVAVCFGSLGLAAATRIAAGRTGKRLEPPRARTSTRSRSSAGARAAA
jgi:sulfoxide reductase heme-binding subunit YedZ